MTIYMSLFNIDTRRLEQDEIEVSRITDADLQLIGRGNVGWVFGWWDWASCYVDENGAVRQDADGGLATPKMINPADDVARE